MERQTAQRMMGAARESLSLLAALDCSVWTAAAASLVLATRARGAAS
ncbi:MAG: hypothetical protein ABW352_03605 [Polyangiales bacterium]